MTVPFILDIIALINVPPLKSTLTIIRIVRVSEVIRLLDTNAKDKANMARFALSGSRLSGELPGLEHFGEVETTLRK